MFQIVVILSTCANKHSPLINGLFGVTWAVDVDLVLETLSRVVGILLGALPVVL